MSITLRILLIVASLLSFILSVKRIKQAKLKVENSIVWMLGSFILIIMSIFSDSVEWLSAKLGFVAPVNFVFLAIIAFLLIEVYLNNLRITELNEKIKKLDHYIALKEFEQQKTLKKKEKENGEKNKS